MAVVNHGGYDCDFVADVPEKLKCAICLLVLKDPWQFVRCGHRFCKLCIQSIMKQSAEFFCPKDRQLTTKKLVFKDTACKQEVLDLLVMCSFPNCAWTGELRDVEKHKTTCLCGTAICPNVKCRKQVVRKNLDEHRTVECPWRLVPCDYCLEFYVYNCVKIHSDNCKLYPVTCPNKCGNRTTRQECTRNALEAHEREYAQKHLKLACAELKAVRNQVANIVYGPTSTKFIWKITDYNQKLHNAKRGTAKFLWSEPFYTAPPGYKIRVKFFPNGNGHAENSHVSVFFQIKKGEYDAILPWPFQENVKVSLLDQEKCQEMRKDVGCQVDVVSFQLLESAAVTIPTIYDDNRCFGIVRIISQDKLRESFIANDAIFLQVEVEKRAPSRKRLRSE